MIATFVGFITFKSEVVSASTIYVGSGAGNHTTSIQDAIDNYANDGDTVYVHSGIYFENVVVNKTINLTGEDKNDTMIYGNGSGDVVTIVVDWVNVSGFTITNGGGDWGDSGIELINVINCEIFNNNVSINNWTGIYLDSSSGNNIIGNNLFFNSWDGIHLCYSSGNNITGNNLFLNHEDGIFLLSSNENYIADNNASNNNDGIDITDSSDNIVENNTFISNTFGIRLWLSNWNNIIIHNTCLKNGIVGVWFSDSSGNKIINNNASNNNFAGIELYPNSNSNNITGNIVSSNSHFGIRLLESEGNNFTGNNVSSNLEHGIYLWFHSNRNTVIGNNVINNNLEGINISSSSNNNMITGNNISNNGNGIAITSSSGNNIYHNNIINNSKQASDDTNNGNQWDNGYPSGGNYWSDFDEPGEGAYDDYQGPNQDDPTSGDGIVDNGTIAGGGKNPYVIDSDSQDNYPLISHVDNFIFLFQGWNLISIPRIQSDTSIGTVLSLISGSYDAVQWYNISDASDPWKHYHTNKPPHLNDLESIDHTIGFWIHITEPGGILFEYTGTQQTNNQTIELHPGWNLVGYPSLSNRNRTEALNNLNFTNEVNSIWTYNAATLRWEEIGETDYFEKGRGYWIHSLVKKTWDVPL